MLTLIYRALIALVLVFVVWNIWKDEDIRNQANGAIVIIPFILRLLMIK